MYGMVVLFNVRVLDIEKLQNEAARIMYQASQDQYLLISFTKNVDGRPYLLEALFYV